MNRKFFCALLLGAFIHSNAFGADLKGSSDHPLVKRYRGSEIVQYKQVEFDELEFCASPFGDDLGKSTSRSSNKPSRFSAQGSVTNIVYRAETEGITDGTLLANYREALKQAGWEIVYDESKRGSECTPNNRTGYSISEEVLPGYYFRVNKAIHASRKDGERQAYVMVQIASDPVEAKRFMFRGVRDSKNKQAYFPILVNILETKPLEVKMELVTASQMAKSLADTGKIDLYGIYFDTDKTAIKPESDATLREVASLLQNDAGLKLEVVGHTDNVGSKEHNDTLSRGRAMAVMGWLLANGIDAERLTPSGRGFDEPVASNDTEEGRAKNRRVELKRR